MSLLQVAAQTGHIVQLVDVKEDILEKARTSITSSVQRVAKKNFPDDPKVTHARQNTGDVCEGMLS